MRSVRTIRVAIVSVFAAALLTLGVAAPAFASDAGDIYSATNAARANHGLAGLSLSGSLNSVAQNWANHMAAVQAMSDDPNVANEVPRGWQAVGENSADGFASGSATVQGWLNSPEHYANIMGNYTQIGVGWTVDSNGRTWAVEVFARYAVAAAAPAPAPVVHAAAPAPVRRTTHTTAAAPAAAAAPVAPAAPAPQPTAAAPAPAAPLTMKTTSVSTPKLLNTSALKATANPAKLDATKTGSLSPIDTGAQSAVFFGVLLALVFMMGVSLVSRLRRIAAETPATR